MGSNPTPSASFFEYPTLDGVRKLADSDSDPTLGTMSFTSEWKYVSLRCYFAYLKRSLDRATQWVVFEPNGEALWAKVRQTVGDFLFREFRKGALVGDRPAKAYFVRCDRSTITQSDLDNGRIVVVIGVATLRPAEFVIIRIGQWTADRKDDSGRNAPCRSS